MIIYTDDIIRLHAVLRYEIASFVPQDLRLSLAISLCQWLSLSRLLSTPFFPGRSLLSVIKCYVSMETASLAGIGML